MTADILLLRAGLLLFFFGVSISLIVLKGVASARQELQESGADSPREK